MAVPPASWTILATLRWTADYFRAKGVPEARASAEILLAHTLGVSRLDLYLRYDQPLNPDELARFKALMVRRREGEPVAYLTGHREFWSLDFRVTPAVLIPRPETETLVAAALEAAKSVGAGFKPAPATEPLPETQNLKPETSPLRGAEVGVGSGAVVIALAKELPQMAWVGLDTFRRRPGRGPGQCPAARGAPSGPFSPGGPADGAQARRGVCLAGGQPALCAPGRVGTAAPGDQGV